MRKTNISQGVLCDFRTSVTVGGGGHVEQVRRGQEKPEDRGGHRAEAKHLQAQVKKLSSHRTGQAKGEAYMVSKVKVRV